MKIFVLSGLLAGALAVMLTGPALADANTDKVIAKMAEGDVASICKGGRPTISSSATSATMALAQTGQISGDFYAIGQAAGNQFFKAKCRRKPAPKRGK